MRGKPAEPSSGDKDFEWVIGEFNFFGLLSLLPAMWDRRCGISPFAAYSEFQKKAIYLWKRRYAGLGVQELHELRQLREENSRLKRIVADLTLDRQILQEVVSKKF